MGKDSPVDIVQFDLPDGLPAGLFKAGAEPADAGADFSKGKFFILQSVHFFWSFPYPRVPRVLRLIFGGLLMLSARLRNLENLFGPGRILGIAVQQIFGRPVELFAPSLAQNLAQ